MRIPRLCLVPVVAAGLAAALAGPAYAGHATVHDASHDVVSLDGKPKPVPTDQGADITRFDTTLTHRRLDLGLTTRGTDQGFTYDFFAVVTPGKDYGLTISRSGSKQKVQLRAYRGFDDDSNGTHVTCGALKVHHSGKRLSVTVPSSCLKGPKWVRTTALALDENGIDEAGVKGRFNENKPHLGRKVHA